MKKTFVTQPFLPPLEDFIPYLQKIWDSKIVTNNGPFHQKLEEKLGKHLGVKHVSLFNNGTLALITALKALGITGEVITTPYSFIATTHSLWWNNIKPVFVDIEEQSFNMDPKKIEAAITSKTSALLPVHVYGYPCQVEEIQRIADKNNLKIIYDAAHAFNVKKKGHSILNFGDLSVLSFHATKVFNTLEGGAIISHTVEMKHHIDNLKNFGFRGETTIEEPGINAKMNEVQSALGLLQLKFLEEVIKKRKNIGSKYFDLLKNTIGIKLLKINKNIDYNHAYFPIIIDERLYGNSRDKLYNTLIAGGFYGRRYFYPLISNFYPYENLPSSNTENLPIANQIADRVLCLPIYPDLQIKDVEKICDIINDK